MPKIQKIKARKQYTCQKCGKVINKGDMYFKGTANFRKPIIRCCEHNIYSWELSSSEYLQRTGYLQTYWRESYETVDEIIDELSELWSEKEEALYNIPDNLRDYSSSAELIQEQMDNIDSCIDALRAIDTSEEIWTSEVDEILGRYL